MASEETHTRQTQHVSGRRLCALAGLLVAVAWSTASCGGHVEAASPPSHPVDELSQHGGSFCPATLPRAPRETYGFGTEQPATARPSLWKPQQAWLCRYVSKNVAPKDSNGAWLEWARLGAPRRLDARQLEAFSNAITQLRLPPGDRACSDDLGPRYLVSYSYEQDLTGVVIDAYGCDDIRLTDDPFSTVPGNPSQPGTVKGVLTGPTGLLRISTSGNPAPAGQPRS